MTTPIEVTYTRWITIGAILALAMLFATVAQCSINNAEVQSKCLDAGHDPAACNNMRNM